MEHIKEIENSSPWIEQETHRLIGPWGDNAIQANLEGMYQNQSIYESILCVAGVVLI